jgi:phosphoenolpyruvate-protein kinase (PTS system EI component)
MGVRNFSMNPFQAPRIRRLLRQMTLQQMESVASDALGVTTQEEVRKIAANALREMEVQADMPIRLTQEEH